MEKAFGAHHFGNHNVSAETTADSPEDRVGHARHRSEYYFLFEFHMQYRLIYMIVP
jgi:hypothetical protein